MSSPFEPLGKPAASQYPGSTNWLEELVKPNAALPSTNPIKRTVFISHSHLHEAESMAFLREFGHVFIAKHIGLSNKNDRIQSNNPDYVMRRIRQELIQSQSIVTIVLVGSCTHSRRYVDWEIKASLQQGEGRKPNGVLAIQLPSCANGAILPPRLESNWRRNDHTGYARYYQYPRNENELRRWIEEAVKSRQTITDRINNPHASMDHNAKCLICGEVHTV